MLTITVKRVRQSVTQGEAHVYINDIFVTNFADDIRLIKPNEKFHGDNIGGWASVKPDMDFIKGALCHPYEDIYDYHRPILKALEQIEKEQESGK